MFLGKDKGLHIVCLTETQHKQEKIQFEDSIVSINQMRERKDKKGGGLMILYKKNKKIELTKVVNRNKNILEVEGKCLGQKIRFILVYFDVKQYKSGGERNEKIKKEVERITSLTPFKEKSRNCFSRLQCYTFFLT